MIREEDPSFFCRKAIDKSINKTKFAKEKINLWIVTDMRRRTDLNFFRSIYLDMVKTVRVKADDDVRKSRNWIFQPGINKIIKT